MEFDRARLMNNIIFLIKEKGLKIGELENAVGISTGYISKMTKADNESMPGIDLIYKLAQKFGVSVEALVNGDFNKSNDNLLFLIKFLHFLEEDIDLHRDEWISFGAYEELQEKYAFDDIPMTTRTLEVDMKGYPSEMKFESQFQRDVNLTVTRENFCGFVTTIGIALLFKLTNRSTEEKKNEYELYVIKDGGPGDEQLIPICSSLDSDGEIAPYIADLYNCLVKHSRDLQVTEEARSIINKYLVNRDSRDVPFY